MITLSHYDDLLTTDTYAALTARQLLEPVEGIGAVIFPPTFAAASKGEKGDYNIDPVSEVAGGGNVCIIDTVGAEANRIEPLFKPDKCDGRYSSLVPQVLVRVRCTVPGKEREWTVNLLDAGHRAGDAIIRFTKLGEVIFSAFRAYGESGNAEQLARIAPTSLVFGVWDSRGTQEKIARAFRSVVRATNVTRLSRSAQYIRTLKYVEIGAVSEHLDKGSGDDNPLSREGLNDNPATGAHGGVIVHGEIRREMTINLTAIRRLRVPHKDDPAKNDLDATLALRRYILGLSLVAATAPSEDRYSLREGCQLRQMEDTEMLWECVPFEGKKVPEVDIGKNALGFATLAAKAFGVVNPEPTEFDTRIAELWLPLGDKEQKKLRALAPMTQQQLDAVQKLTGNIVSILTDGTGIKVATGKGKSKQEIDVTFASQAEFKGSDGSTITIDQLQTGSKVEIKHQANVAQSITLK